MAESVARRRFRLALLDAARRDPRVVGVLDYGSSSEGRLDEWPGIDVALFVRDDDLNEFTSSWQDWAAQLGRLLLAYVGRIAHPWAVYDAEPVPLRVDFDVHPESHIERLVDWPNSPASVEAMLWYDGTRGRLEEAVRRIVGQDLRPRDLGAVFVQDCGDFWYFSLFSYSKLRRGEAWVARQAFHGWVMEPLLHLLRIQADAIDRREGSPSAWNIERVVRPAEFARLQRCIPGPGRDALLEALRVAAVLGFDTCTAISEHHGFTWPRELGERVVALFDREART